MLWVHFEKKLVPTTRKDPDVPELVPDRLLHWDPPDAGHLRQHPSRTGSSMHYVDMCVPFVPAEILRMLLGWG